MECAFYGQYAASRSPDHPNLKAKCPECGAVRLLQKRSGNMWFFPRHRALEGDGRQSEQLVYVNGEFVDRNE